MSDVRGAQSNPTSPCVNHTPCSTPRRVHDAETVNNCGIRSLDPQAWACTDSNRSETDHDRGEALPGPEPARAGTQSSFCGWDHGGTRGLHIALRVRCGARACASTPISSIATPAPHSPPPAAAQQCIATRTKRFSSKQTAIELFSRLHDWWPHGA